MQVKALRPYLPDDLQEQLIEFQLQGVTHKTVAGIDAETFVEICQAYVTAAREGALQTERELVYDYLDKDVADWLRENAPAPRHGQNYHQWLSGQYGLKKLTEHLWMLVGMAAACQSMSELKQKMAERFGRQPVQYTLFLPPPARSVRQLPRRSVASKGQFRASESLDLLEDETP